jgi:molybdopterin converting factor small subunit
MNYDNKIKIKLKSSFAVGATEEFLANFQDGHEVIIELTRGSNVLDLLNRLSSIGSAHEWDDMLLHVFVNNVLKGMDYVLQDGDEINLHLPISGG